MDDFETGKYWEGNAEAWTRLSRAGWDISRDYFNTPAFLELLPDVTNLTGLDIGCGEGHNTRLIALRVGRLYAIDVSRTFIRYANAAERDRDGGIRYAVASAQHLPFASATFDFATAFMSLMDMPRPDLAFAEAFRVLKPGGFLQFSITHPCFDTPYHQLLRNADGAAYAVVVGRYFDESGPDIQEWLFSAAPPEAKTGLQPFRIPNFHRPLSVWFNSILDAGFRIERLAEPFANDEAIQKHPSMAHSRIAAYYLHVRCRKP